MTTAGVVDTGTYYTGSTDDGRASAFLFGSTSAFDAQHNFDGRFGLNYEPAFPTAGVAVFKFRSVKFAGAPVFQTSGGPIDLAILADNAITSAAPGGAVDLGGLRSFTLGSVTSSITLGSEMSFNAAAGSALRFIQLYTRGGAVSLDASVNAPDANLFVDTSTSIKVGTASTLNINTGVFAADTTITLDGAITAKFLQLYSGGALTIAGSVNADAFYGFASSLTLTANLATSRGSLQIGSGGVTAGGYSITGFDSVSTTGNYKVATTIVNGALTIDGQLKGNKGSMPTLVDAQSITAGGGMSFTGNPGTFLVAPTAGQDGNLFANSILFDITGINGGNFDGGDADALSIFSGGDGGTLNVGTVARPISGTITVNTPISAVSGSNGSVVSGGKGGNVNMVSNDTVSLNSAIKVSNNGSAARASSAGGNISVKSNKTTGTAIAVSSSAQLLSLLNNSAPGPGGSIKFVSAGGAIDINGATVTASKGTVELTNNGTSGVVNINNANLNASTVKARALGSNGTLNVGGGTISADSTINLYAGGSNGTVNFTDNVTLSGTSVKTISGNTVTVVNGKIVTISGPAPASVFTNNPNYSGSGGNGSTTGTFGGSGATTSPLSAGPGPGG